MRVLVLGLDNAGKTTITRKLANESLATIPPTLGFNITTLAMGDYTLHLWDVGGQSTLRAYWKNYFDATDAVVWVVDSSDALRMKQCRDEMWGLLAEERLIGASLLIFANKQDVEGCLSMEEIRDILGLNSIKDRNWKIIKSSAMTGEGLLEGFEWIISEAEKRIFM